MIISNYFNYFVRVFFLYIFCCSLSYWRAYIFHIKKANAVLILGGKDREPQITEELLKSIKNLTTVK